MIEFVSIVMIVFGILQIILFFKLWGMTNDVKKLRNKFAYTDDFNFEVRKSLALGEKAKAKGLIINSFFEAVHKQIVNATYDTDVDNSKFSQYKNELEKELNKIGEKMPDELKNINSYEDFQNLF
jgi:hypothetical protein